MKPIHPRESTASKRAGLCRFPVPIAAIACFVASQGASAHVEYYDLNQGAQIADLTAAGKLASQAQYGAANPQDLPLNDPTLWNGTYQSITTAGVFSGVSFGASSGSATVAVNDVTDFGWGAGTQARLGDSHEVDFFNFRLPQDSTVNISWTVSTGSSFLDSGFTLYGGSLVYQGHDDTSVDAMNPLGPGFVPVQNPVDSGSVVDVQGNISPLRDTVNNADAYVGQFNALGGWSQANAAGNWSALRFIQAVDNQHTRFSSNSANVTETLSLFLTAGNYTLAASGALLPGSTSFGLTNLDGQLSFSYSAVPVPSAIWFLLSSLLGLGFSNLKRKPAYLP